MMAAVMAMADRVSESAVGRFWASAGDFLDCAIPIALVPMLVIGTVMVIFGLVPVP
jgi:hypothetical protein